MTFALIPDKHLRYATMIELTSCMAPVHHCSISSGPAQQQSILTDSLKPACPPCHTGSPEPCFSRSQEAILLQEFSKTNGNLKKALGLNASSWAQCCINKLKSKTFPTWGRELEGRPQSLPVLPTLRTHTHKHICTCRLKDYKHTHK